MKGDLRSDLYSGEHTTCSSIPKPFSPTRRFGAPPNPQGEVGSGLGLPRMRTAAASGAWLEDPPHPGAVCAPLGRRRRYSARPPPPAPAQEGGGRSKMAARVLLRWSPAGAGAVPRLPPGGGLAVR